LIDENNASYVSSDYWILNTSVLFINSGNWLLNITCYDNNANYDFINIGWFIPFGNINVTLLNPIGSETLPYDVLRYSNFNVSVNVSCYGGECSELDVYLDPSDDEPPTPPFITESYTYGSASLMVWDEADYNMPYASNQINENQSVMFYANYTNSSGMPISDANCVLNINDSDYIMSYNPSYHVYYYNKTDGFSRGVYDYNIICNHTYYQNLTGYDYLVVPTLKHGLISTISGDVPFYTYDSNPKHCEHLYANTSSDHCNVVWVVNATGQPSYIHKFFAYAVPLNYTSYISQKNSSNAYVRIVSNVSGPYFEWCSATPNNVILNNNVSLDAVFVSFAPVSDVWVYIYRNSSSGWVLESTLLNPIFPISYNSILNQTYKAIFYVNDTNGRLDSCEALFNVTNVSFSFVLSIILHTSVPYVGYAYALPLSNENSEEGYVAYNYSSSGNFTLTLPIDTDTYNIYLKLENLNLSLLLKDINVSKDNYKTIHIDYVNNLNKTISTTQYRQIYAIKPEHNFSLSKVRLAYNISGESENHLNLTRCDDWNFTSHECLSSWSYITAEQNKSSNTFTFNTTSFSAFAIKQEYYCGDGLCSDDIGESCSTCPEDCGVCPSGTSGGGGGISRKNLKIYREGNCSNYPVFLAAYRPLSVSQPTYDDIKNIIVKDIRFNLYKYDKSCDRFVLLTSIRSPGGNLTHIFRKSGKYKIEATRAGYKKAVIIFNLDYCPKKPILRQEYCTEGYTCLNFTTFAYLTKECDIISPKKCDQCINNECITIPEVIECPEQWVCLDNTTIAYQLSDCSYTNILSCDYLCQDGQCINITIEKPMVFNRPSCRPFFIIITIITTFLIIYYTYQTRNKFFKLKKLLKYYKLAIFDYAKTIYIISIIILIFTIIIALAYENYCNPTLPATFFNCGSLLCILSIINFIIASALTLFYIKMYKHYIHTYKKIQSLKDYIVHRLLEGDTKETLSPYLSSLGWPDFIIDEVFDLSYDETQRQEIKKETKKEEVEKEFEEKSEEYDEDTIFKEFVNKGWSQEYVKKAMQKIRNYLIKNKVLDKQIVSRNKMTALILSILQKAFYIKLDENNKLIFKLR